MKNHLQGLHKALQNKKNFFKKSLDKSAPICYNIVTVKRENKLSNKKQKEVIKMVVAELMEILAGMPADAEVHVCAVYDSFCAAGDQVDEVYMEDGAVVLFSEE